MVYQTGGRKWQVYRNFSWTTQYREIYSNSNWIDFIRYGSIPIKYVYVGDNPDPIFGDVSDSDSIAASSYDVQYRYYVGSTMYQSGIKHRFYDYKTGSVNREVTYIYPSLKSVSNDRSSSSVSITVSNFNIQVYVKGIQLERTTHNSSRCQWLYYYNSRLIGVYAGTNSLSLSWSDVPASLRSYTLNPYELIIFNMSAFDAGSSTSSSSGGLSTIEPTGESKVLVNNTYDNKVIQLDLQYNDANV